MSGSSKIEWTDSTLDIITGCRHGCDYCYANVMSKRFCGDIRWNKAQTDKYERTEDGLYILRQPFFSESGSRVHYPFGFEPTLHLYKTKDWGMLGRKLDGHGKKVFVGAMSDVFGDWVPDTWISANFILCRKYPLNNYLFLTKNPKRYRQIQEAGWFPPDNNFWFGTTITGNDDKERLDYLPDKASGYHVFVSYEPMVGPLDLNMSRISWLIMGAQTGRNIKRIIPEKEWITKAVQDARDAGIPVFMKDSLLPYVGPDNILREYPDELMERKKSPNYNKHLEARCIGCRQIFLKSEMVSISGRKTARGYGSRHICYACFNCLREFCKQHGIDDKEIIAGITKKPDGEEDQE